MTARQAAPYLLAGVTALLAVALLLWAIFALDDASDAQAFAVSLLDLVALPTCLTTSCVLALRTRVGAPLWCGIAGVTAAGLAAAGFSAGVFVADDPTDPVWIRWFGDATLPFLLVAVALAGVFFWAVFHRMSRRARLALTLPIAVVSASVAALVDLQATTILWLAGLALPVVLILTRSARRRRAAVGA